MGITDAPFPVLQEAAIASYDWTDISSGDGYRTYYCYQASGAYVMGGSIYSSEIVDDYSVESALTEARVGGATFELSYNKPATINGDVIVSIPYGANALTGSAGQTIIAYASCALIHESDGTDTTLGHFKTKTVTGIQATSAGTKRDTQNISVSNEEFKRGDQLKLVVDIIATSQTTTGVAGFGHDPKNRDDDSTNTVITDNTVDTILEVNVPYKIDI